METGKMCNSCNVYKHKADYYKDKTKYSGLSHWCKSCTRIKMQEKYHRDSNTRFNCLKRSKQWGQSQKGREYNTAWHRSDKGKRRRQQYYKDNKEQINHYNRQYYQQHVEYICSTVQQYIARYPEWKVSYDKEYGKYWRRKNPDKLRLIASRRKATMLQAIPKWADENKIKEIYKECCRLTNQDNISYEVDHIVPLQSDKVCGLHCEANLRIITSSENRKKKNKWPYKL